MFDFRRIRPLDAAIAVALALVIGLGAFLGYTMWSSRRQVESGTPAARAVEELIATVRKNPDDLSARMRLAQAFSLVGRRDEAVRQYNVILKVEKEYAPAIAGLGVIALQERDHKVAESYFRKAIAIYTKAPAGTQSTALEKAYFYLANALMEQKEYEEAANHFKAALRIKRDSSVTHYLLSVCLRELGLRDAQRDSLGNALLFDPKHPEANYDMGQILLKEGDVATAAEHFRLAADSAPNVAIPRDALAKLGRAEDRIAAARKLMNSDAEKALDEARIAVALEPRSAEALVVLGDAYAKNDAQDKARDAYRRALGIEPENVAAKAGLERVDDGS